MHIDKLVSGAKAHLDTFIETSFKKSSASNFSREETAAIKELRGNTGVVIKQADKIGAVTVLNTSDYIQEAESQLNDFQFYCKLSTNPRFESIRNLQAIKISDVGNKVPHS